MSPSIFGRALALALIGAGSLGADAAVAGPDAAEFNGPQSLPHRVGQLSDARLNELSGLAASRRYPGCFWAHNDSGDEARLFLIGPDGATRAVLRLEGIEAIDWEDVAIAPSNDGGADWIVIGDIGDNARRRPSRPYIELHGLREPALDITEGAMNKAAIKVSIERAHFQSRRLLYPDGARDAEGLIALPNGDVGIISKSLGSTQLWLARSPFGFQRARGPRELTLERIGQVNLGGISVFSRMATAADLRRDGRALLITTYTQAHEWPLSRPFDLASLDLSKAPLSQDLPPLRQSESAGYTLDGSAILVGSEGQGAPLYLLPSRIGRERSVSP